MPFFPFHEVNYPIHIGLFQKFIRIESDTMPMGDISIWIRAMPKSSRALMYKEMPEEMIPDVKERIFIPWSAYPKKRGRPPKYDFLFISIVGMPWEKWDDLIYYLEDKLKRPVESWRIETSEGYAYRFIAPWRDREGKVLPNKMWFFKSLRYEILNFLQGKHIKIEENNPISIGKEEVEPEEKIKPQEEKPEEKAKPKISDEVMINKIARKIVIQQRRDELNKLREDLKKKKDEYEEANKEIKEWTITKKQLEEKLKSLEMRTIFSFKSDKKKAKNDLEESKRQIRLWRTNRDNIKKEIEVLEKKIKSLEREIENLEGEIGE